MKPQFIALAFALVANAAANILIKEGMKAKQLGLDKPVDLLLAIALNPLVLGGVVLFGLNVLAYSYVLSKIPLSLAYPIMTTMGFLIVVGYSAFKLHESINMTQLAGIGLILAGVVLVASQMK